jgi:hypothetical protein
VVVDAARAAGAVRSRHAAAAASPWRDRLQFIEGDSEGRVDPVIDRADAFL